MKLLWKNMYKALYVITLLQIDSSPPLEVSVALRPNAYVIPREQDTPDMVQMNTFPCK